MTIDDFPMVVREALSVHQVLRRLGFSADDIYVAPGHTAADSLHVVLRTQGKQWAIALGPQTVDGPAMRDMWLRAIEYARTAPEAELVAMFDGSVIQKQIALVAWSISQRGIELPLASASRAANARWN
jgi:hypothetical protein